MIKSKNKKKTDGNQKNSVNFFFIRNYIFLLRSLIFFFFLLIFYNFFFPFSFSFPSWSWCFRLFDLKSYLCSILTSVHFTNYFFFFFLPLHGLYIFFSPPWVKSLFRKCYPLIGLRNWYGATPTRKAIPAALTRHGPIPCLLPLN